MPTMSLLKLAGLCRDVLEGVLQHHEAHGEFDETKLDEFMTLSGGRDQLDECIGWLQQADVDESHELNKQSEVDGLFAHLGETLLDIASFVERLEILTGLREL